MKRHLLQIAITIVLMIILFSCSVNRTIHGKITKIAGDQVTLSNGYTFKIKDTSIPIWLNKEVSFTPTVNRKKINSKKIN